MQGTIYEEPTIWQFLIITCLLGGTAAWVSGRSMAHAWRSWLAVLVSAVGLGIAVRFVHHALYAGTFFSLHYYLVDTVILLVVGSIGYRFTRTTQMVTQYRWLYEKTGPFTWRARQVSEGAGNESG